MCLHTSRGVFQGLHWLDARPDNIFFSSISPPPCFYASYVPWYKYILQHHCPGFKSIVLSRHFCFTDTLSFFYFYFILAALWFILIILLICMFQLHVPDIVCALFIVSMIIFMHYAILLTFCNFQYKRSHKVRCWPNRLSSTIKQPMLI